MIASKSTKRRLTESEGAKPRQRRKRTAFTNDQLDRLEEEFREEKFPGIDLRTALADELGIREDRIQVWFQNRRARWRKREIKNKPASLHTGLATRFIPPTPYQTFANQTAFPPLGPREHTNVTWSFPAPPTPTTACRFPPLTPGHSPWTSTPLHYFPPSTTAMTRPPVFPPSTVATTRPPVFPPSSCQLTPREALHQKAEAGPLSADEYIAAVTLVNAFNREQ